MQRLSRSLVLSTLVACTQGNSPTVDITISMVGTPTLLVVRDDASGDWIAPEPIDATTYRFVATGPYRITLGCELPDTRTLVQVARTLDDDPEISLFCSDPSPATGVGTIVTTMAQPGSVEVGFRLANSDSPDWEVSIAATAGKHTLVAQSDEHVLIQRGIHVTSGGETTLPAIDVATQGVAFEHASLDARNVESDERLDAVVWLEIEDTVSFVHFGDPSNTRLVPKLSGTEQFLQLVADDGTGGTRHVDVPELRGATVTLPARLGPVSFTVTGNELAASWAPIGKGTDSTVLQALAFTSNFSQVWFHRVIASPTYTSSKLTLEIEDIPDMPASLLFDHSTVEHELSLRIGDETGSAARTERRNVSNANKRKLKKLATRTQRARR